jgi:hypothetical protein
VVTKRGGSNRQCRKSRWRAEAFAGEGNRRRGEDSGKKKTGERKKEEREREYDKWAILSTRHPCHLTI